MLHFLYIYEKKVSQIYRFMRKKSRKEGEFLNSGRIKQKMKTREKLLEVAHKWLIEGNSIDIEKIAKEAQVSKATAYRYFSSKDVLQREASLHSKSEEKENLFSGLSEDDLDGRIEILISYHFDILTKNEAEFRLYLSAVMKESVQNKQVYTRAGRRVILIEEALKPLRKSVSVREFDNMVSAISTILGIESITILKDICSLRSEEIFETWKWMIKKIISR